MFKPSQQVTVVRTDGRVEEDWYVAQCPHPSQLAYMAPEVVDGIRIRVVKPECGTSIHETTPHTLVMEKWIPLGELACWQDIPETTYWASVEGPHAVPDMGVLASDAGLFAAHELLTLLQFGFTVIV